jgi:hypothetical protein
MKNDAIILFSQKTKRGNNNPELYLEMLKEINDGILSFVWERDEYSMEKRRLAWVYAVEQRGSSLVYKGREIPDPRDLDHQYPEHIFTSARQCTEKELKALRKQKSKAEWGGTEVKAASLLSLIVLTALNIWHYIAESININKLKMGLEINEPLVGLSMFGLGLLSVVAIIWIGNISSE